MLSFDRVADVYDTTRAVPSTAGAAITRGIVRVLREVAPEPRLLEVGIGTGRIAVPLAAAGVRVVGVDVAPRMLARLRARRDDIPVAVADAQWLPFRLATFDAALFVHVLHLLPDAPVAVRAAAARVRAGGALLLGRTDYSDSPRRRVFQLVFELAGELAGVMQPPADWNAAATDAFRNALGAGGLPVTGTVLASWDESTTGRKILDALEARVSSSFWSIPDAAMPELRRRLTPQVEELLGGLDRAVVNQASFTLEVLRLPVGTG